MFCFLSHIYFLMSLFLYDTVSFIGGLLLMYVLLFGILSNVVADIMMPVLVEEVKPGGATWGRSLRHREGSVLRTRQVSAWGFVTFIFPYLVLVFVISNTSVSEFVVTLFIQARQLRARARHLRVLNTNSY